ncbi:uncharacterized protein [Rutidosis leptorrhynchoides]|uniref:uncharacterized protein n=1 Tax=Rutidosis leptorrhynchoides TaxID=125765 RepID=UPI003A98FBCC
MNEPSLLFLSIRHLMGRSGFKFNSEKVAYLAYGRIQGKASLVAHFQTSGLMNEDKRCCPILFHADGPNAGDQGKAALIAHFQNSRLMNEDNNIAAPILFHADGPNVGDQPRPSDPAICERNRHDVAYGYVLKMLFIVGLSMFSDFKGAECSICCSRCFAIDFGPKPIKIFDEWLVMEGASKVINDAWNVKVNNHRLDGVFRTKLKNLKYALREWSQRTFGKLDNDIEGLMNEACAWEKLAECRSLTDTERDKWLDSRKRWFELEKIKTSMAKQKSRVKWILEGEENTKYFHSFIKRRHSRRNIRGLNIGGVWCENPIDIKQEVFRHFNDQFKVRSSNNMKFMGPGTSHNGLLGPMPKQITPEQADCLEHMFSESEVLNAIGECCVSKAPGPDGFNFKFFKLYWGLVKNDLINALNWFWDKCDISNGCNASFVTLVPKKIDPMGLNDFRPIILIGCYYKILAKILSIRIRNVLPGLIDKEQSAFLKGRYILDGALIVNESIDFLKRNKRKSLMFKVDFEKAFDSLSWDFLLEIMKRMGFGDRWRKWILACLQSASISILVNGSPTNEFRIERGVRQGDPISPFLFIIAAEGLNLLTKRAIECGLYKGVKIGSEDINISHLQYADDTIFLGEWNRQNFCNLMKLLKCFENASGLKINYNKSKLFGLGVNKDEVEVLAIRVGCKIGELPFTYLGLPMGKNMNRVENWDPVIEKFNKRLSDWKARTVSYGGRLTLVKSVLSSLPLYYFSLFRAPLSVIKILEISLSPYDEGGLNIGSLRGKNLALLGKWFWRAKTECDSLWVSVIRSIHGTNGLLLHPGSRIPNGKSSVWVNIMRAGYTIEDLGVNFTNSFSRLIGDGSSTQFWEEPWLITAPLKDTFKRLYHLEAVRNAWVRDRIAWSNLSVESCWNWLREPTGRALNELNQLLNLLNSYVKSGRDTDTWVWNLSSSGLFTTKRLATLIDEKIIGGYASANDETLKNNLVPLKVELFIWRMLKRRIPVRAELDKRGIDLDSVLCPLCDNDVESIEHLMVFCQQSMDIWERVYKWWGLGPVTNLSINEAFRGNCNRSSSPLGSKIWQALEWTCAYLIWRNRNQMVFSKKSWNSPTALMEIQLKSFEWISTRIKGRKLEWLTWLSDPWSCLI